MASTRRSWIPLARFACAGARGDRTGLARAIHRGRALGWQRRALEEVGLMLVLYAGYPAALEALRELLAQWPARAIPRRGGGPELWRRRGAALCRRVYGPVYPRLVRTVRALHPDLAVWMEEQGYGRVLARPGLSPRLRELVTVAVLAHTGWERQLVSHLLGARRTGATLPEIRTAATLGVSAERSRALIQRAWRTAFPKTK